MRTTRIILLLLINLAAIPLSAQQRLQEIPFTEWHKDSTWSLTPAAALRLSVSDYTSEPASCWAFSRKFPCYVRLQLPAVTGPRYLLFASTPDTIALYDTSGRISLTGYNVRIRDRRAGSRRQTLSIPAAAGTYLLQLGPPRNHTGGGHQDTAAIYLANSNVELRSAEQLLAQDQYWERLSNYLFMSLLTLLLMLAILLNLKFREPSLWAYAAYVFAVLFYYLVRRTDYFDPDRLHLIHVHKTYFIAVWLPLVGYAYARFIRVFLYENLAAREWLYRLLRTTELLSLLVIVFNLIAIFGGLEATVLSWGQFIVHILLSAATLLASVLLFRRNDRPARIISIGVFLLGLGLFFNYFDNFLEWLLGVEDVSFSLGGFSTVQLGISLELVFYSVALSYVFWGRYTRVRGELVSARLVAEERGEEVRREREGRELVEEELVAAKSQALETFTLRNSRYYRKFSYTEILWFEIFKGACQWIDSNGKPHPIPMNYKEITGQLSTDFCQIHRRYIVNRRTVVSYDWGREEKIVFAGEREVRVGRAYQRDVRILFGVKE